MHLRRHFYNSLDVGAQAQIDQLRYKLGLLPRVSPLARARKNDWLPPSFKACAVISADFEMAWAWRYERIHHQPLALAIQKARQTRQNMPKLLELFDRYEIPVTWATVGHLFLDRCERENGKAHGNMPRPPYFENEFWRYKTGDWYEYDPCNSSEQAPEWYAPDIIHDILSMKVKHEIACHTFSHIDCSDEYCPPELMDAELAICRRLALVWGIDLRSFVFPANLVGNLSSLKKVGFTNYRFHSRDHLGLPEQDEYGLWRIPGGVCFEFPQGWPVKAWIGALNRCLDKALETRTLLHLWFHPSCEPVNIVQVFPVVLETIHHLRDILWVGTMADVCQLAVGEKTIKNALD